MSLVASLRARARAGENARRRREHLSPPPGPEREVVRLARLNAVWAQARTESPWWRERARAEGWPETFSSVGLFLQAVPPLTREDLAEHVPAMACAGRPPDFVRITGGSTARPVRIPSWLSERRATRADIWLGRGWYGITPASPLFLLWGHGHLLGSDWKRPLRVVRQTVTDRALGCTRWPAYDLQPSALRRAGEALLSARPEYVIGYSVALDLLAQANADRRDELRRLELKAVIGTAEGFPSPDSAERIADVFGCPAAMEYGAVETGLLAHTRPGEGFEVFWRSHLVEVPPGGGPIRVTALYPRCVPLLRYEIGDEAEPPAGFPGGIADRILRVVGRCNDYVELADGTKVHSEAFSHAVRGRAEIRAYQVVQVGREVTVRYVSKTDLPPEAQAEIAAKLGRVHPDLAAAAFERVDGLERTVAGKTRMVVRG